MLTLRTARRMVPLLAAFTASLTCGAARADELAPLVIHQPIARAVRGEPLELRARLSAQGGRELFGPTAFVRLGGVASYTRIPMQRQGTGDLWIAPLPAALVSVDFDYYLETFDADGNGPGRAGSPEQPIHVSVEAPAPKPASPAPAALKLDPVPPAAAQTPPLLPGPEAAVRPPRKRSQLVTFALNALGGAGLGAGVLGQVAYRETRSELGDDREWSQHANMYRAGQTAGTISVIGFVTAGVAFTSAALYALWPEGDEAPASPGGER